MLKLDFNIKQNLKNNQLINNRLKLEFEISDSDIKISLQKIDLRLKNVVKITDCPFFYEEKT